MNSTWFDDDNLLVRELQRSRRAYEAPRIPGYDELQEVRRGGQGIVFAGRQVSTRRRVAIKLVLEGALATREARRRFEREIELVAGLRHPNIVRIYDSGETADGRLYYVMEYIEGAGLDEVMNNPLPFASEREMLTTFAKICDGVQHAHQQGVIHRDLKPSNVRIDPHGEPHVLDFGLAKLAGSTLEGTLVSRSGSFMGSLPWASPEQADGSPRYLDVRSDVYSLGVILYQLLTGQFPYRVDGPLRETLQHIQSSQPRPPREVRREIGDELGTITLKCLSKEPARRYQSAGELARDIRRFLAGEPIEAKRDSAWYSVRKTLHVYKTAARVAVVLLVASLVFSGAMVWLRSRAVKAEQLAAARLKDLETQVAKNRKVSEFLDTTLRAVDPWKHPGRDLGPLRELLDSAVKRLEGAFPDQPEVEAAIAATLGWDYRELGVYDSAETLLRRAFALSAKRLGETHPDTLKVMDNLGTVLTDRGRHEDAAAHFERLRGLQLASLGAEHPATLVTLNNLALAIDWQGRASEAETFYRQALEAQTRLLGKDHVDRLTTLNNLAACVPALGKLDESAQLYRELIDVKTSKLGAGHPETLQAQMNLGDILNRKGRFDEAEQLLRGALATMKTTLTSNHPLTITAMHNLADTLSNRGLHDEALVLARQAFEAQSAFAGPLHPSTLNRKNEFACMLVELKRWDEAIPIMTELRDEYQKLFAEADWRTLNAAGNLAFALNQSGQSTEAEAIWKRIIAAGDLTHEANINPVVTARANLASLFADRGQWRDSETEFRAAIEIQDQIKESDNWRTAFIRAGLGRVLTETGPLDEARRELERAYKVLHDALGDEHEKTQRTIGYLVAVYTRIGNAAAAARFSSKIKSARPPTVAAKSP